MKATCTTFVNILNTIHKEGITTKSALIANQLLCAEFWFALEEFCHFALLSKSSGKNAEGEFLPGNAVKIDVLEFRGATTRREFEIDKEESVVAGQISKYANRAKGRVEEHPKK